MVFLEETGSDEQTRARVVKSWRIGQNRSNPVILRGERDLFWTTDEDEARMLVGGGTARIVAYSSLTIRGLRQRLFPRSSERGPIEAHVSIPYPK